MELGRSAPTATGREDFFSGSWTTRSCAEDEEWCGGGVVGWNGECGMVSGLVGTWVVVGDFGNAGGEVDVGLAGVLGLSRFVVCSLFDYNVI